MILETYRFAIVVQSVVTQRHPAAFAAPAHVDELLPVGQQLQEGGQGVRRIGVGFGEKLEAAGSNLDGGHAVSCLLSGSVIRNRAGLSIWSR